MQQAPGNAAGHAIGQEFFDGPAPSLMSIDEFTGGPEPSSVTSLDGDNVKLTESLGAKPCPEFEEFMQPSASSPDGRQQASQKITMDGSASDGFTSASPPNGPDKNGLAEMLNSGASSVASRLPWLSKDWKSFSGRDHGSDSYRFGDVSRGMIQQAMPQLRQFSHKYQELKLNVKEQVTEKKHQLLHQVVSELDGTSTTNVPSASTSVVEAKRWWTQACAAAHSAHDLELDPPPPPQRASMPEGECARGCLEVEVLSFSSSPPLSRPDGGVALGPVCQLALGSRWTGALRPLDASAGTSASSLIPPAPSSSSSATEVGSNTNQGVDLADSADATPGSGAATSSRDVPASTPEANNPQEPRVQEELPNCSGSARSSSSSFASSSNAVNPGATSGKVHMARFAVDEILGCDLRVHIFDSKQHSFNIGMEDNAFCGGGFLPLSAVLRCGTHSTLRHEGFFGRVLTHEIKMALLPLEAVRMAKKLKSVDTGAPGLERPSVDLGHVCLRVQLTLYDMVPWQLYCALPFRGERLEAMTDVGRIDDPMSVLKAVASGVQRVRRAVEGDLWFKAFDQLREAALSATLLLSLWTYAMLIAPVWKLPAILVSVLAMFVWQVSSLAHCARKEDPPRLYKDELSSGDSGLTYMERVKKTGANAIKVELGLMEFARKLHTTAMRLEKILYLVMLRDPYLSAICGGFILGTMLLLTICLGIFMAIFGRSGPPLLVWACGLSVLLPSHCRTYMWHFLEWLQEHKVKYFGQGKLIQAIESFWLRIPDGPEAVHCDLFERYSSVP